MSIRRKRGVCSAFASMAIVLNLGLITAIGAELPRAAAPGDSRAAPRVPEVIAIRPYASELELLAANEVRRYVYLRTGRLLQVKRGTTSGERVIVTCKDRKFCGELGQDLSPQQFLLKTATANGKRIWSIVGGDGTGTLYGAYRFAEKLGVSFGPAVIRRLHEGTFLRIMRKMPVDYYWFWAPETWLGMEPGCPGWEITTTANVERDLSLAEAAAKSVQARFGWATCGWRLGTRADPLWMDKHAPKGWAASSLSTSAGRDPVEKHYGTMTARPRWVIGWAEDDGTAGAHCCTCWDLQLWVERMFANSSDALRYGCEGMLAIHWRTSAIAPNITALAQAGWSFEDIRSSSAGAAGGKIPAMDAFWREWGRRMFGGEVGIELGRLIQKFDGRHGDINALIYGGARTTDARIAEFFAPLKAMESLRPRIQGAGNLERCDYWLNQIWATQLRVRTWVLADRLTAKMNEANRIPGADQKRDFARSSVLPLRLELVRSYEDMIAAFVHCAKSPGEVGTIASIESGSRGRIVSTHDAAIAKILGQPLPVEAAVRIGYRGAPRVFVSGKCSQMNAGQQQEIRAFVLSGPKPIGLNLYCRSLGEGTFTKVVATHRSRHAYRVALPAQSQGAVEYYLEAVLNDGQKVLWPARAPSVNQTAVVW